MISLIAISVGLWILAGLMALLGRGLPWARVALVLGAVGLMVVAVRALPGATPLISVPFGLDPGGVRFVLAPAALWLLGFGLPAALLAAWLGSPSGHSRQWTFGFAMSLVGALGVFAMQDAASFLVFWEIMSLGGAVMILGEGLADDHGRGTLFMLALLEVGTVALMVALVLLSSAAASLSFADFPRAAAGMPLYEKWSVGVLLLVGFGAKIGILPFYEWFPSAYGAGSGATGAVLSGIVLNAAYFGLGRGLLQWLHVSSGLPVSYLGILVVAIGVLSAILTTLYAFQQDGWRQLLSFSSAENGSIAVSLIGAALLFRHDGLGQFAGLAWAVGLIHLAGHALAKGALFLTADWVYRTRKSYALAQAGILRRAPFLIGLGALFAAMSLAAMPPQAGFVSEWFVFQTVFQGFHLLSLGGRLTMALAGAGLALTAAIALATFVKAFGVGLLGDGVGNAPEAINGGPPLTFVRLCAGAIGGLGGLVLVLAVGMPVWLNGLTGAVGFLSTPDAAGLMHQSWILVPLTSSFAFISPSELVIAMPILALLPIGLLVLTRRPVRRAPVWYGGQVPAPGRAATTALTFSNALRTFYSFVYRPTEITAREPRAGTETQRYFIARLVFNHDVAPIFGPHLFCAHRAVRRRPRPPVPGAAIGTP